MLTASRATEYSFEGTPTNDAAIPGSVFTTVLASGIRTGAADTDADGYISVDDAYTYAFDEMRAAGAEQTPQRWLYGAEGDIVLSRNPTASGDAVVPTRQPGSVLGGSGTNGQARSAMASAGGVSRGRLPTWWKKGHRLSWSLVAAVVAVVAAGVIPWRPWTSGGGAESEFAFRDGRFVDASGPWYVTVSAGPDAPGDGCSVNVRDGTTSGPTIASVRHPSTRNNVILQVTKVGSFYLDYPDGCLVNARGDSGDTPYPVRVRAGVGDSLAWNPSGTKQITAKDSSTFPCDVNMIDAEHGGSDLVTLKRAGDIEPYTPPETSSVFMRLSGTNCFVTARDAATTEP